MRKLIAVMFICTSCVASAGDADIFGNLMAPRGPLPKAEAVTELAQRQHEVLQKLGPVGVFSADSDNDTKLYVEQRFADGSKVVQRIPRSQNVQQTFAEAVSRTIATQLNERGLVVKSEIYAEVQGSYWSNGSSYSYTAIYKSNNNGASWELISLYTVPI